MQTEFLKKDNSNKKTVYLYSAILGLISTFISMMFFAAVLLFFNIDRTYSVPFATVSLAVGSFVASRFAAKKIGEKGYITGLVMGFVVFAIITVISLMFGNGFSLNTLFHFIIILLSALTGGIVGVNTNKHKKYI